MINEEKEAKKRQIDTMFMMLIDGFQKKKSNRNRAKQLHCSYEGWCQYSQTLDNIESLNIPMHAGLNSE